MVLLKESSITGILPEALSLREDLDFMFKVSSMVNIVNNGKNWHILSPF